MLLIHVMVLVLNLIDMRWGLFKWDGLYLSPIYFKTMDIWYWEFGVCGENVVI